MLKKNFKHETSPNYKVNISKVLFKHLIFFFRNLIKIL